MRRTLPLNALFLAVITPVIVLSTAGFGYAAYVRLYATILEGFDRKLAALSSATSVYIDPDETLALLAQKDAIKARGEDPEQHPIYLKYVVPMRQVRERAGLTYLYTQLLLPGAERKCVYLLDGTVGEGHSEFGEEDNLPEEDWPVALRVVHDGDVAQTAIREWEQWGLLKCGWAPMYGADGTVKAMAGADVEITIIRQKTYVALLQTLGVGALALLLASIVSVRVARKLTHPLGEVREAALRIASGNYRARCRIDSPREMNNLAQTLNSLAHMMETAVGEARPRMEAWRKQRAEQALVEILALRPHRTTELAMAVVSGRPTASGFAIDGDLALLWHGRPEGDELAARRRARDIEHIGRALLQKHGATAGDMLLGLMTERIDGCALIDRQDWSVRLAGTGFVVHGEGIGASGRQAASIPQGRTIVIASAPLGATLDGSRMPGTSAPAALDAITSTTRTDGGVVAVIHRPARQGRGHAA